MCWSKIWSFLKRKYCASKTTQKLFKSIFWKSLIAETFEILDLQTFLVMAISLNILMLIYENANLTCIHILYGQEMTVNSIISMNYMNGALGKQPTPLACFLHKIFWASPSSCFLSFAFHPYGYWDFLSTGIPRFPRFQFPRFLI